MIPRVIPEGREVDTHSDHAVFEKVGLEPNRFEIVFVLSTPRTRTKPWWNVSGSSIKHCP
jgi:hypothetical protein